MRFGISAIRAGMGADMGSSLRVTSGTPLAEVLSADRQLVVFDKDGRLVFSGLMKMVVKSDRPGECEVVVSPQPDRFDEPVLKWGAL